jgi:hypothetical protein
MCQLVHTMFELVQTGLGLFVIWVATEPWEAARRLYLVIQYLQLMIKLRKALWKKGGSK